MPMLIVMRARRRDIDDAMLTTAPTGSTICLASSCYFTRGGMQILADDGVKTWPNRGRLAMMPAGATSISSWLTAYGRMHRVLGRQKIDFGDWRRRP